MKQAVLHFRRISYYECIIFRCEIRENYSTEYHWSRVWPFLMLSQCWPVHASSGVVGGPSLSAYTLQTLKALGVVQEPPRKDISPKHKRADPLVIRTNSRCLDSFCAQIHSTM